ncbi:hypothetical protein FO519_005427 [Halicephalobus sp. NKZ332]|nr:hypothetical protein FO519_005427 [Halicephalobus sp. NKZ332]
MDGTVTKELRSWLPRLGSSEFVVLIEGLVWDNGKQRRWRSGPISVRIESNVLQASSGNRYRILGRLDHQMCAELCKKEKSTAISVKNITSISSKKTPNTKKRFKKKDAESTVKVTRSGRLSRPPLASWANQRIIHDIEGNPIEATGITTKTKFNKNETPKLGLVCQKLGLKLPSPTKFEESKIDSPVVKKIKRKDNSALDYESVDEESLTGCEDFLTPIIPRKKESKKPRNVLESANRTMDEVPEATCIVEYPESEEEEESTETQVKKRWLKKEKEFFLRTLKMLKPKTDREWESTINSLGYPGPFEEYKGIAKNFGWVHPDEKESRKEISNAVDSENNENENPLNVTIAEEAVLTARPGTAAYAVQIDKLARKIKPKPMNQKSTPKANIKNSSNSSIHLDRSMLDLLMSPEEKYPVPRMHFQPSLQVATPKTPTSPEVSRTSVNVDISPITERQREQMIRRIHQAYAPSRRNKTRMNSRTKVNSTYFDSTEATRFNINQFSRSTRNMNRDLLPEEMEEEEALYSEDETEEM